MVETVMSAQPTARPGNDSSRYRAPDAPSGDGNVGVVRVPSCDGRKHWFANGAERCGCGAMGLHMLPADVVLPAPTLTAEQQLREAITRALELYGTTEGRLILRDALEAR